MREWPAASSADFVHHLMREINPIVPDWDSEKQRLPKRTLISETVAKNPPVGSEKFRHIHCFAVSAVGDNGRYSEGTCRDVL